MNKYQLFTENITSLTPPASLFEIFMISNCHFFFEHTFSYILKRSAQNKEASNPPVPALISTIAFLSSSSSFGNKKIFSLFSLLILFCYKSFKSFSAIFFISGSFPLSCKICSKSFFTLE